MPSPLKARKTAATAASDGENVVIPHARAAGAAEPHENSYAAGDIIASKYRLSRALGEGGMGTVWLARNQSLDVDVAVKLVKAQRSPSRSAKRLLQEARSAALLQHPSIVRVFDFGNTSRGDPFIVMEVVRGESLSELLDRRGRLPALEAVQLLLPIVSALSVAHAKGIVHRDVKPDNIILMLAERGEIVPKLVDFGIAKVTTHDSRRPVTAIGAMIGSPDYMAPEQIRCLPDVDERVDIWALCVALYETMAGRRPFDAPSAGALFAAILSDDPAPLTKLGVGDAELWSIVERGLMKNREERCDSMRLLGRDLARWACAAGVGADVSGTSLRHHWLSEGASEAPPRRAPAPAEEAAPAKEAAPTRESQPRDLPHVAAGDDDAADSPDSAADRILRARWSPRRIPPPVAIAIAMTIGLLVSIIALFSRPSEDVASATTTAPTGAPQQDPEPGATATSSTPANPSAAASSAPPHSAVTATALPAARASAESLSRRVPPTPTATMVAAPKPRRTAQSERSATPTPVPPSPSQNPAPLPDIPGQADF